MACLLPGVNSAISVRDEWTNISQWMKLNYVFSELEIGQRSKHHSCDNLYFKLYIFGDTRLN